jgi:tetratricopeptide (TPR) repeat protein
MTSDNINAFSFRIAAHHSTPRSSPGVDIANRLMAAYARMSYRFGHAILTSAALSLSLALMSCQSEAQKANQALVQQNEQTLEAQQREIEALKAGQSYAAPAPPPGSCDNAVMNRALAQGSEKFTAGDYSKAVDYYKDALSACPGSARAELNIGRAYEAMGDRAQARSHYQAAASSTDPNEANAAAQARDAMTSLEHMASP